MPSVLCIYWYLFKDALSSSDYIALKEEGMINWEGCGRKQSRPNLKYYPSIYLEGLRKAIEILSHNSWPLGQDLNSGPPEYKAGVLTT
jgi:hypothetical protein